MSLLSPEIKGKYFYRVAMWDWLTEDMIHVMHPGKPRMITMDAWPQQIFLEADGTKAFEAYIASTIGKYASGKAPKELEPFLIRQLANLVEEGIVALSDSPVMLAENVINPSTEEGIIDLAGTWHGMYTYDQHINLIPKERRSVSFTISIAAVTGNQFTGTVQDDLATGGTPGIGKVTGTFTRHTLTFDKQMPINSMIDEQGNSVNDESKPHPAIRYSGSFSRNKQYVTGEWRFKKKKLIWRGLVPYWVTLGDGQFTMEKA